MKREHLVGGLVVAVIAIVIAAFASSERDSKDTDEADLVRHQGYQSQVESALKNAATAEESYLTGAPAYTDQVEDLYDEGLQVDPSVEVVVLSATSTSYCLQASHADLPGDHPYQTASYDSNDGRPRAADSC